MNTLDLLILRGLCFLLISTSPACSSEANRRDSLIENSYRKEYNFQYYELNYQVNKIVLFEERNNFQSSNTSLNKEELTEMKKLLEKGINDYNLSISKGYGGLHRGEIEINRKYTIQYLPYTNERGQKLVWINGFCDSYGDNRTIEDYCSQALLIQDGGSCHFVTTINISENQAGVISIGSIA